MPGNPISRLSSKRTLIALLILGLLAVPAIGLAWFFGRTAPEEVSLEAIQAAIPATTSTDPVPPSTESTAGSTSTTANDSGGISGTWTVDTSLGSFSFEEATASFVGFRIEEELSGIGSNTAVGRTPEVSGTLQIEGTTVTAATVEADLTALVSNDSRRDGRIQQALETGQHPSATFVLTEPIELGDVPQEGEPLSMTALGDLSIHGVTNSVAFQLEAQLTDGMILVVGSTDLVFDDYQVRVPSAPIVLSVEDHGIVELQLWFTGG